MLCVCTSCCNHKRSHLVFTCIKFTLFVPLQEYWRLQVIVIVSLTCAIVVGILCISSFTSRSFTCSKRNLLFVYIFLRMHGPRKWDRVAQIHFHSNTKIFSLSLTFSRSVSNLRFLTARRLQSETVIRKTRVLMLNVTYTDPECSSVDCTGAFKESYAFSVSCFSSSVTVHFDNLRMRPSTASRTLRTLCDFPIMFNEDSHLVFRSNVSSFYDVMPDLYHVEQISSFYRRVNKFKWCMYPSDFCLYKSKVILKTEVDVVCHTTNLRAIKHFVKVWSTINVHFANQLRALTPVTCNVRSYAGNWFDEVPLFDHVVHRCTSSLAHVESAKAIELDGFMTRYLLLVSPKRCPWRATMVTCWRSDDSGSSDLTVAV